MTDTTRPTGPTLAEALGGTFDLDNGTVRFPGRTYFVRCGVTGKVQLVFDGVTPPVNLGLMSEGVEVLRREFRDALCACPPCPGRGNDGHGMTHCAECCFGTGVEADPSCPVHGESAYR